MYTFIQNAGVKQYRNERHVIIPKPSKLPYYYIHKQNNKIQFSNVILKRHLFLKLYIETMFISYFQTSHI